ncbi:MICOS complex subunit MIC27-like [Montipora capricornis]|uniref:MICOS complex subunit MIC27-like n=1 Tax=Montipora capricornis TaxID=246305 RepID=UPI0035F18F29
MATNMVVAGARSRWRRPLLVAVSIPVLGMPFLSSVKAGSIKVHPRELEIYDPLEQSHDVLKPSEEEVTGFQQKVSSLRKFVWGWTTSVQEGVDKARQHFSLVEQRSIEFVELIQTDKEFQMKVGGISAAVLTGAVLAGRGRRPVRRILYSGVLGTTALAICYPKEAVDITLANYDRLKAFMKEQISNFNQKKAEQPVIEEAQSVVEETVIPEGQEELVDKVAESASVNTPEEQDRVVEVEETVVRPEDANEEKPKSSFWSRIPFFDKLVSNKEESVVSSDAHPTEASSGELGSISDEGNKDQVIVLEQSTGQPNNFEGEIGQSNPEDKDMYSTRS